MLQKSAGDCHRKSLPQNIGIERTNASVGLSRSIVSLGGGAAHGGQHAYEKTSEGGRTRFFHNYCEDEVPRGPGRALGPRLVPDIVVAKVVGFCDVITIGFACIRYMYIYHIISYHVISCVYIYMYIYIYIYI